MVGVVFLSLISTIVVQAIRLRGTDSGATACTGQARASATPKPHGLKRSTNHIVPGVRSPHRPSSDDGLRHHATTRAAVRTSVTTTIRPSGYGGLPVRRAALILLQLSRVKRRVWLDPAAIQSARARPTSWGSGPDAADRWAASIDAGRMVAPRDPSGRWSGRPAECSRHLPRVTLDRTGSGRLRPRGRPPGLAVRRSGRRARTPRRPGRSSRAGTASGSSASRRTRRAGGASPGPARRAPRRTVPGASCRRGSRSGWSRR